MPDHRLEHAHLVAGRWRAVCSCGHVARGILREDAVSAFVDHTEQAHLVEVYEDAAEADR